MSTNTNAKPKIRAKRITWLCTCCEADIDKRHLSKFYEEYKGNDADFLDINPLPTKTVTCPSGHRNSAGNDVLIIPIGEDYYTEDFIIEPEPKTPLFNLPWKRKSA